MVQLPAFGKESDNLKCRISVPQIKLEKGQIIFQSADMHIRIYTVKCKWIQACT